MNECLQVSDGTLVLSYYICRKLRISPCMESQCFRTNFARSWTRHLKRQETLLSKYQGSCRSFSLLHSSLFSFRKCTHLHPLPTTPLYIILKQLYIFKKLLCSNKRTECTKMFANPLRILWIKLYKLSSLHYIIYD